jgi:hypothetical protein
MRTQFTDLVVRNAKPPAPGSTTIWDTNLPGLCLRTRRRAEGYRRPGRTHERVRPRRRDKKDAPRVSLWSSRASAARKTADFRRGAKIARRAGQGRADSAPTPAPEAATPFRSREADDAGEGSGGVPGAFPCASALGLVTRDWLACSVNRLPPLASHRLDNASGEQGQSLIY